MGERKDLSNPIYAEQSRNKTALIGMFIMNTCIAVAFYIEVIKGARTFASYLPIALSAMLPPIAALAVYFMKKESKLIRYINSICYIFMYAYLMFTTTTDLTFCFIIVFFSVFIVYGDIKFSVAIGAAALLINGILLVHKHNIGTLDAKSITNGEIMMMCIFLTTLFACLSMWKIFKINHANFEKAEEEKNQSQKLLKSVLELTEYISENITVAGKETDVLKGQINRTGDVMREMVNGAGEAAGAIHVQEQFTDNINKHIQQMEASVASIMQDIQTAEEKLADGTSVMGQLLEQVRISEESSEMVGREMADLRVYADKMQDIMALISNVSKQTGMLAINASIEAARAGAAGKSFAVVASEVSSLSAQTNEATKNITELIGNVSASIAKVSASIDTLLESCKAQNAFVDSSAKNLDGIQKTNEGISAQTAQLNQVMTIVTGENQQVTEKIHHISALTDNVSGSANITLDSCNDNLRSMQKLTHIIETLGQSANELQEKYNR